MFDWIISIIVSALVLLIAAKLTPRVEMRSFGTAIVVALIVGILSGLITFLLNVATLGIFWFTSLGFITRTIATAIVIKIADALHGGFRVYGFTPALILAIVVAIIGTLVDRII